MKEERGFSMAQTTTCLYRLQVKTGTKELVGTYREDARTTLITYIMQNIFRDYNTYRYLVRLGGMEACKCGWTYTSPDGEYRLLARQCGGNTF